MRIIKYLSLLSLLTSIMIAEGAANPKRPWTFLVYMAADNNLNPEADYNIAQMVKASTVNNVYILVYLNIKRSGQDKMTQRLIIQNGKILQEGETTVEDSGDPQTLIKALVWAITEYPSAHLFVDLWNHGSGSLNRSVLAHRGVCYDDTTGHYLTDLAYKSAFDVAVNQYLNGQKIDIIAFDACLMSDIEVAFTLAPYANYMVASQQTVPGPGYDYSLVLAPFAKGTPDAQSLARSIVAAYNTSYKNSEESYTLAATDLGKLSAIVGATNNIAQLLDTYLASDVNGSLQQVIAQSADPSVCAHFDEPTYLDLYTFYANLYTRINSAGLSSANLAALRTALKAGLSSISQAVFANVHSNSDFAKVRGQSIYFADINAGVEPSYGELYWTQQNPQWAQLLNDYVYLASNA